MKIRFHTIFYFLLAGMLTWGMIVPYGLRGAALNNAWSVNFINKYYGNPGSEADFPTAPVTHAHAGFFLASQAMRQGNYEKAKEYLQPLVEASDLVALSDYAEILYLQQNYAQAFKVWERLGQTAPLLRAVDNAAKLKKMDVRCLAFQSLYVLDPERSTFALADCFSAEQNFDSAISILRQSIHDFPGSNNYTKWLEQLERITQSQKE